MGKAGFAVRREVEREERADDGFSDAPWKTILHNCDCHSFDEVEKVLIKATRCTLSRARQISHEVHTRGLAVAYEGPKERCEAVAEVIGSVGLRVTVAK